MRLADLPLLNACINAAVTVLLLFGLWLVKRGRRVAHQWVMLSAVGLSILFLASYVTYHAAHGSTKFMGQGFVRPVYFAILISHTVLAVVNLPFVVLTVARGLKGQLAAHVKVAKRTWAIWLYVAITGPVVYLMLYRFFPGEAASEGLSRTSPPSRDVLDNARSELEEARKLHRDQREPEALAKYRQAAAAGSKSARCYAAVLGDRLEGTSTASKTLALALEEPPEDVHCVVLFARERVYEGHEDEAIPLLERAVKAVPEDAFFLASLGFAHFRKWSYREAAAAFERSIALDPTMTANVYNAGYAHFLAGDYGQAKPLLERALALGLDAELTARAREDLGVISGALWICPMHPEVVGKEGETCARCGMLLEPSARGLAQDSE